MNRQKKLEQLISDIYKIVKDYRADEGNIDVQMTTDRIKRWIEQFEENDQKFILTELKGILMKRYCSKKNVLKFLKKAVKKLTEDFNYSTPQDFLNESVFLDLQPAGNSQQVMNELMQEVLAKKYDFDFKDCGSLKQKNFIYLDDVLCTGNTLFQDIKAWANEGNNSVNKTNKETIEKGSTILICAFIIMHWKNYHKKRAQMKHNISESFSKKVNIYSLVAVENDPSDPSSIEILLPIKAGQSQPVLDYELSITEQVDAYMKEKKYDIAQKEFYRHPALPQKENLFLSKENRKRFENIILTKGIDILKQANVKKNNIRALGFSLPSFKDFGFGTVCFTWRNVPNNTPLVFWYATKEFFPLFEKRGK